MDSTRLHYRPAYQHVLDAYLAGLERTLRPEAVAGVYLTGSIALGDYRHGQSDLDILTLTTRPLTDAELDALDALHKELEHGAQPHTDAHYVPRDFVGEMPPADLPGQAFVVDGVFHRGLGHQDLVTWATLDQCGITLRGPKAETLSAGPDPAAFAAWNRGNLEEYWRAQAASVRAHFAEHEDDRELPAWLAVWLGTGPGRLHRTIADGTIISKTRSAEYTAEVFPAYAELLTRVRASRLGEGSAGFGRADAFALCDLIDEICDSASLPG